MIKYRTITSKTKVGSAIICDVCKKTYSINHKNRMEINAFYHINFTGGYSSIFGDGESYSLDICQHCLKEKLGDYVRKVS